VVHGSVGLGLVDDTQEGGGMSSGYDGVVVFLFAAVVELALLVAL
jgi:hypothetical protein